MTYSDEAWKEAKQKCRLNAEDVARAKRLGLNPRSLIKNLPSKSQQWKAPVGVWLREIEEKRNKKTEQKQRRREKAAQTAQKNTSAADKANKPSEEN